jgi:hypothetical protein
MNIVNIKTCLAKDNKNIVVIDSNTKKIFGSVERKNNKFAWCEIYKNKMCNAIYQYKYWNFDWRNDFKFNLGDIKKLISNLKKDLIESNINLYNIEYMGKWYNGSIHYIEYLWEDTVNIVEEQFRKINWADKSFIMTDDIYMLHAIKHGTLRFQHNINSKDIDKFSKIMQKYNKNYIYERDKEIDVYVGVN